jgi:hypothetical protein
MEGQVLPDRGRIGLLIDWFVKTWIQTPTRPELVVNFDRLWLIWTGIARSQQITRRNAEDKKPTTIHFGSYFRVQLMIDTQDGERLF